MVRAECYSLNDADRPRRSLRIAEYTEFLTDPDTRVGGLQGLAVSVVHCMFQPPSDEVQFGSRC